MKPKPLPNRNHNQFPLAALSLAALAVLSACSLTGRSEAWQPMHQDTEALAGTQPPPASGQTAMRPEGTTGTPEPIAYYEQPASAATKRSTPSASASAPAPAGEVFVMNTRTHQGTFRVEPNRDDPAAARIVPASGTASAPPVPPVPPVPANSPDNSASAGHTEEPPTAEATGESKDAVGAAPEPSSGEGALAAAGAPASGDVASLTNDPVEEPVVDAGTAKEDTGDEVKPEPANESPGEGAADEASPPAPPEAMKPPLAVPVQGKPGLVTSPHLDEGGELRYVDVSGIPPGTLVKCPYSGKHFRVP